MSRYLFPLALFAVLLALVIATREDGTLKGMARVIDGATVVMDGRRLRLEGLRPFPLDEVCPGAAETGNWPCGREAAYALSRLIDRRGLECTVKTDTRGDAEAHCMRGDADVALEMLRRGWARTDLGGDPAAAQSEARRARRGIWR